MAFVLQTMRTEIPLIDVYFGFDKTNFLGETIMTFKPVELQQVGQISFFEIFTPDAVSDMLTFMDNVVKEEAKNVQVEETWFSLWNEWKEMGIEECETLDDVIYIAGLQVDDKPTVEARSDQGYW